MYNSCACPRVCVWSGSRRFSAHAHHNDPPRTRLPRPHARGAAHFAVTV